MKWKSFPRKIHITKILLIIIIIGLIGMNTSVFISKTIIPYSTAADPTKQWNVTIMISESSGVSNTVILGEVADASDSQDSSDLPAPPTSPQLPAIAAWFDTSFPLPFDKLLHEYKHYPSMYASWNLSILWLAAPGNTTSTSITIHWDSSQIIKHTGITLFLYENNTVLTDMLVTNSYLYITNSTLHRFQIISQYQASNNSSEQNSLPMLLLLIAILVIFIVIVSVVLLLNRKKKNSIEKWKQQKKHPKTNKKPPNKKKIYKKRKR